MCIYVYMCVYMSICICVCVCVYINLAVSVVVLQEVQYNNLKSCDFCWWRFVHMNKTWQAALASAKKMFIYVWSWQQLQFLLVSCCHGRYVFYTYVKWRGTIYKNCWQGDPSGRMTWWKQKGVTVHLQSVSQGCKGCQCSWMRIQKPVQANHVVFHWFL